jgi:hypothetical protein
MERLLRKNLGRACFAGRAGRIAGLPDRHPFVAGGPIPRDALLRAQSESVAEHVNQNHFIIGFN